MKMPKLGLMPLVDLSMPCLRSARNLVMRNPAPIAGFETSRTLVAAYQMILPGEHAPSHRHSSHALRVIIDGKGSYSIVGMARRPRWKTGDVVLHPGVVLAWSRARREQTSLLVRRTYVPLTHLLEPMFFEEHPQDTKRLSASRKRRPIALRARTLRAVSTQPLADPEGFYGPRVRLEAPTMPSMGLIMERLASGTQTRRYRTTANSIFHIVEGSGESTVGRQRFAWSRGDTFVVPGWHPVGHQATSDAQLFVLSDEPLLRFSNYYRFKPVE